MSIYPPTPGNRAQAVMVPLSTTPTATPNPAPSPTTLLPNTPQAASLAQGSGSDLTVTWAAPAVDSAHSAATAFDLQSSPSGANTWTTASDVTSPYDLSGLAAGAAIDVRIQSANSAGTSAWSATSTLTTASGSSAPNTPSITSVAPPPDGTNTKLTVSWTAPATDSTHGAATGYNLRYGPSGAGIWTTVSGVTSPYAITALTGASTIDVEVQATGAAATASAWSTVATGTTWGATVVTWRLDRRGHASPRDTRSAEHRREHDRDRCTDRGNRGSLRLVREPVRTSHHQPDRRRRRRPDQRMGAVVQRAGHRQAPTISGCWRKAPAAARLAPSSHRRSRCRSCYATNPATRRAAAVPQSAAASAQRATSSSSISPCATSSRAAAVIAAT